MSMYEQIIDEDYKPIIFKNHYNSNPDEGEINDQPSETVPDQSMSVSEILRRFASGLPLGGEKVPLYEGDEDLLDGINPKTLDLSEIAAIRDEFTHEVNELKSKAQIKADEKEFKRKLKEIEAENSLQSPEGASNLSEG